MVRKFLLILGTGTIFVLFQSNNNPVGSADIPEDVQKILVASCYDCHSSSAKNKDAREALNFETWDSYRVTKQIGLLGDICKLVEENKMPPEKYLGFKPDRKLTAEQKKMVCDWSSKESERLMGGN